MPFTQATFAQLLSHWCHIASVTKTAGAYAPTDNQRDDCALALNDACDLIWRHFNDHVILPCLAVQKTVTPVSGVIARADVEDSSKWSVWTQDPRASWSEGDGLWPAYLRKAVPDESGLRVENLGSATTLEVFYQKEAPRFHWAAWVGSGHAYAVDDVVLFTDGHCYKCLMAHNSDVFATELADAKWRLQSVPVDLIQAVKLKLTEMRAANTTQRPAKEARARVTAESILEDVYLAALNAAPPWYLMNGGVT